MQTYYNSAFYHKVESLMQSEQITEGAAVRRVAASDPDLHERAIERANGAAGAMTDEEILAQFKGAAPPLDRMAARYKKESPSISEAESYRRAIYYIANSEAKK